MVTHFKIALKVLPLLFLWILCFSNLKGQEVEAPEPLGGSRLMKDFIREEMVYPPKALSNKVEGTVKLEFTVGKDGAISKVEITESVSEIVDAEALRVFKKICWKPATQIGKPVPMRHTFEIPFKIRKYNKWVRQRGYENHSYPFTPIDTSFHIYKRTETDQAPRPLFNSIDKDLPTFLSKNLSYPEAAFRGNVSGTVRLMFVVEPNGRISNIETAEAVGGGCTEEAIRVVKLLNWYPGIKNNKAVRTRMPLEITFDISKKTVGGAIPSPGQLN